ncbi:MAG: hypothetical protein OEX03_09420, partial [Gammaproteobacteria bacterium]|nr:hypothetical protein [Gammaproteobacteria bacterium]
MKDFIDILKNTDSRFAGGYVLAFLATIAPGVLIIYLYKPNVFLEIDTIKFILFSLALSLPL